MKKEKLILSFIATFLGLMVAGVAFYFYQTSKITPEDNGKVVSIASPTPTTMPTVSLILENPKDEAVVDNNVLAVSGETQNNAVVVVINNSNESVTTPSENGKFSTTVDLDNGENVLKVISIAPNGESVTIKRTVTYSEEEF
jgi:hypothetical protein